MITKFRAWDKEKKMMNIVDGIHFDEDKVWEISCHGVCWKNIRYYTLMQSTGLHDKNGKEIFEGDIVRAEHENFSMDEVPPEYKPYVGFIKYVKTGYSIITKDTFHPCLSNIRITNIEVLGNIHEHSHLLENGGTK